MPAFHNGKKLAAYHNGKRLKAYQNGKLILGGIIEPLDVNPISLTFEWNDQNAKTATITGGKSPYSFADSKPSWLGVSINGDTITVNIYDYNRSPSQLSWDTNIVDSKGNTVSFSVVSKGNPLTFVMVGTGGNINFTNDSGTTWT
jgi:hypothetical protein